MGATCTLSNQSDHGATLAPSNSVDLEGGRRNTLDLSGETGSITSVQSNLKKQKAEKWSAIANVVLVEGKDLPAMDFEGTSDPYCKFRYLR